MVRIERWLVTLAAAAAAGCGLPDWLIPDVKDCSAYVTGVRLRPEVDTIEVGRGLRFWDLLLKGGLPDGWYLCTFGESWSVSDGAVLALSTDASNRRLVVGVGPGTATVTYAAGAESAAATITVIPPRTAYVSVDAGYFHLCVRAGSADSYCWDPGLMPGPLEVSSGGPFVSLDLGGYTVCGVTAAQRVVCWSIYESGPSQVHSVAPVPSLAGVESLDAGGDQHRCVLTGGGAALCWGSNVYGQLGNGSASRWMDSIPVRVAAVPPLTALALGANHSCALAADGTAWCWGDDRSGQVGRAAAGTCTSDLEGTVPCQVTPAQVAAGTGYRALAAGGDHTCALDGTGQAWCWGQNAYGELGTGDTLASAAPRAVSGAPAFVAISAGRRHTCAVTAAGAAYCWGADDAGQLGDGGAAHGLCGGGNRMLAVCDPTPAPVAGGLQLTAISAAELMTCGIAPDGAWCWGTPWGAGSRGASEVPVRLPGQP